MLTLVVLGGGMLIGGALSPAVTGQGLAAPTPGKVSVEVASGGARRQSLTARATLDAPVDDLAAAASDGEEPEPDATAASPSEPASGGEASPAAPVEPVPDAPPSTSDDDVPPVKGIVVHLNRPMHSYSLATAEGELITVAASRLPALGSRLNASLRQRPDGSFTESKRERAGHSDTATVRGTVTFSDPALRSYAVSAPGASILIHAPAQPPAPAPALPPPPKPGTLVAITVGFERIAPAASLLRQRKLVLEGTAAGPIEVAGVVAAVDSAARSVSLSADDVRESGRDIVLYAAPRVRLDKVRPGATATATIGIGPSGAYTLITLAQPPPQP